MRICPLNIPQKVIYLIVYFNYYLFDNLSYFAQCLFLLQPDFESQKYEIERFIISSIHAKYYLIMYYQKYHCKLNYIEYFWCSVKKWVKENCWYTLENFQSLVPYAIASISNKLLWYIIIVVNKKWTIIEKDFSMDHHNKRLL